MKVLVTGASRGIGRAVARALVERGHEVTGTSRRPADDPGLTRWCELDLEDPDSVERCIREVGPVDVLVNNAGRSQIGAVEDVPIDTYRQDFEVNLFGPVRLVQAVLPSMRERGRGWIVNVGSLVDRFAVPFQSSYTASKCALAGFTWSLRHEVAGHGIRVVLVEPNDIGTDITPRLDVTEGSAYEDPVRAMARARERRMSSAHPPEVVADRILDVLDSDHPAPFHVVGGNGPLLAFLRRLLPDGVVEHLVRREYGL